MRLMAENTTGNEQKDIPRAPPPSPELPHHQNEQFNFAELLSIASLKGSSPSSSTEHSRSDSPLFYHSPEHIYPPSGSVSPTGDSPYSYSSKFSELSLTHINYPETTTSSNSNSVTSNNNLMCGSLPVNGGDIHAYMDQHGFDHSSDFNDLSNSKHDGTMGSRRRKVSLKRQHDNHQEYSNDTSPNGIQIINKKLCHTYVGSAPSHARRSHTFSDTHDRPQTIALDHNHSLKTSSEYFQVGSVPANHYYNHTPSNDICIKSSNSECLSPGSLKTVGFSTNGMGITDEQMEGVEMEIENETTPPSIPISVTQMDWNNNGGISLTGNIIPTNTSPQNTMNSYSFALPSQLTSYNHHPSSLSFHLNVPGFDSYPLGGFLSNQQQEQNSSIPQITLTPNYFSKSL